MRGVVGADASAPAISPNLSLSTLTGIDNQKGKERDWEASNGSSSISGTSTLPWTISNTNANITHMTNMGSMGGIGMNVGSIGANDSYTSYAGKAGASTSTANMMGMGGMSGMMALSVSPLISQPNSLSTSLSSSSSNGSYANSYNSSPLLSTHTLFSNNTSMNGANNTNSNNGGNGTGGEEKEKVRSRTVPYATGSPMTGHHDDIATAARAAVEMAMAQLPPPLIRVSSPPSATSHHITAALSVLSSSSRLAVPTHSAAIAASTNSNMNNNGSNGSTPYAYGSDGSHSYDATPSIISYDTNINISTPFIDNEPLPALTAAPSPSPSWSPPNRLPISFSSGNIGLSRSSSGVDDPLSLPSPFVSPSPPPTATTTAIVPVEHADGIIDGGGMTGGGSVDGVTIGVVKVASLSRVELRQAWSRRRTSDRRGSNINSINSIDDISTSTPSTGDVSLSSSRVTSRRSSNELVPPAFAPSSSSAPAMVVSDVPVHGMPISDSHTQVDIGNNGNGHGIDNDMTMRKHSSTSLKAITSLLSSQHALSSNHGHGHGNGSNGHGIPLASQSMNITSLCPRAPRPASRTLEAARKLLANAAQQKEEERIEEEQRRQAQRQAMRAAVRARRAIATANWNKENDYSSHDITASMNDNNSDDEEAHAIALRHHQAIRATMAAEEAQALTRALAAVASATAATTAIITASPAIDQPNGSLSSSTSSVSVSLTLPAVSVAEESASTAATATASGPVLVSSKTNIRVGSDGHRSGASNQTISFDVDGFSPRRSYTPSSLPSTILPPPPPSLHTPPLTVIDNIPISPSMINASNSIAVAGRRRRRQTNLSNSNNSHASQAGTTGTVSVGDTIHGTGAHEHNTSTSNVGRGSMILNDVRVPTDDTVVVQPSRRRSGARSKSPSPVSSPVRPSARRISNRRLTRNSNTNSNNIGASHSNIIPNDTTHVNDNLILARDADISMITNDKSNSNNSNGVNNDNDSASIIMMTNNDGGDVITDIISSDSSSIMSDVISNNNNNVMTSSVGSTSTSMKESEGEGGQMISNAGVIFDESFNIPMSCNDEAAWATNQNNIVNRRKQRRQLRSSSTASMNASASSSATSSSTMNANVSSSATISSTSSSIAYTSGRGSRRLMNVMPQLAEHSVGSRDIVGTTAAAHAAVAINSNVMDHSVGTSSMNSSRVMVSSTLASSGSTTTSSDTKSVNDRTSYIQSVQSDIEVPSYNDDISSSVSSSPPTAPRRALALHVSNDSYHTNAKVRFHIHMIPLCMVHSSIGIYSLK
jgi:hypothetical protein